MKIEKQLLDDHQVKLTVEVEDDRLEEMKHRAAAKLAKRIKIPGFRPGKAPYPVVVRTIGESAIFEEALEMLIDTIYPDVIKEADISPYGPGYLEGMPTLNPLTLEIIVPLNAEVTLGDYKAIRKPYEPDPVSENSVDNILEFLQEQHALVEPVDRPAQQGDVVTVLISARKTSGEEELIIEAQSVSLVVGEDDEEEWPFPGFSLNLLGKVPGDEAASVYRYPEDYAEESLQGVEADFNYQVETVKQRTLPELNDDFAMTTGGFEDLESLRESIRTFLERQSQEVYNEDYDEAVIDEAINQSEFKYPPQMLEDEIDQVKQELIRSLERQGLDLEIYLKSREMDEAAFREELKPEAERQLKRGLLIFEIGKVEDVQVEREELASEADNTLNYLYRSLPKNEARRLKDRDFQSNLVKNVLIDLLTEKTIERLRKIASGQLEMEAAAEQSGAAEEPTEPAEDDAASGASLPEPVSVAPPTGQDVEPEAANPAEIDETP